jgi:hypothetical protein
VSPLTLFLKDRKQLGGYSLLFIAAKRKTARELTQGGSPVNCVDLPVCLFIRLTPPKGMGPGTERTKTQTNSGTESVF